MSLYKMNIESSGVTRFKHVDSQSNLLKSFIQHNAAYTRSHTNKITNMIDSLYKLKVDRMTYLYKQKYYDKTIMLSPYTSLSSFIKKKKYKIFLKMYIDIYK
ncbi:hypothetical protein EGW08_008173 [Elysia chlorotica]|uniref:Uncharacterized protein n=1 Tax=Elysia chlorotica TaxID=188477 RepID=A0A3S1HQC1_ELYCH|nr:hypothetical protein EGW08_008173 [Elysia chlorotica]